VGDGFQFFLDFLFDYPPAGRRKDIGEKRPPRKGGRFFMAHDFPSPLAPDESAPRSNSALRIVLPWPSICHIHSKITTLFSFTIRELPPLLSEYF
jgi:hypothetical protein